MSFKYLILGAGGTGGPIGAYLNRAGKDVTLIARGEHLRVLREQGLKLEKAWEGPEKFRIPSYGTEDYQDRPDVIFVCVKGYSLEKTVPFIRRISGPGTVVIPILNLYGTGRKLQRELPDRMVADGCIYISANLREPGTLFMHGEIFRIFYGMPDHRTDEPKLKKVEADLREAGIEGHYSPQIEKDAMQKFSYVSPMAACGLYYDAEAGDMQRPGKERELFAQLIDEIQLLAESLGIRYDLRLREVNLDILDHLAPTASTSMQRDIAAGKPSEIDGLIFEVDRLARQQGLKLPGYQKVTEAFRRRGYVPAEEE